MKKENVKTEPKKITGSPTVKLLKKNWELLLFILPPIIYLFIFHYVPLYGIQIAFKDFDFFEGIWGSPWCGLKHFKRYLTGVQFWPLLKNTLAISLYSLAAGFPVPIILALLLNTLNGKRFKGVVQTVSYAPHFISTVILVGLVSVIFGIRGGVVNEVIKMFGGDPILFMGEPQYFRHIYVWSGVWQSAGWGSIMYLSVLSGSDPGIHEAAIIDGATRLQRVWYIDIPVLLPTVTILLIMRCSGIIGVGFEKVYLMQNPVNMAVSEVISTYTYKIGLLDMQYSYSTAIGLFNNLVNCILLVLVNGFARKVSENSLW